MMELVSLLTCFNILNIVVATPYGYGINSGAAAKADSSALAGAFGGITAVPLSIPSGGSVTGSFTKSSSSSFAASSASSSSSSFTVSGSSPGLYSHHGLNGIPKTISECTTGNCQTGCTTGNCQSNDSKDISNSNAALNTDASQIYNSAKAGAVSGAVTGSISQNNKEDSGCNGNNCFANSRDTNCKDAQCSPSQDSNDIQVKGTSSYSNNFNSNDKANSYNIQSKIGAVPNYSKPATYLTTPKESTSCTSCGFNNKNVYDIARPSSYNVPIHGSYVNPSSETKPAISSCTSGNCGSNTASGPTYKAESPGKHDCTSGICRNNPSTIPQNIEFTEQNGCMSGNCGSLPSTQQMFAPPPFKPSGCSTPNCIASFLQPSQPSHPTFSQPGPTHSLQSNTEEFSGANVLSQSNSSSSSEKVSYKGGFGGPPGLLKPNDFGSSTSLNDAHSSATNPTLCLLGNCESKPQHPNNNNNPAIIPTGAYSPGPCISGKCSSNPVASSNPQNPSSFTGSYVHTAGFGGPTGILKPNDYTASSILQTDPIQKPPTSPCSSGTCGTSSYPSSKPPMGTVSFISSSSYPAPVSPQIVPQYKPTAPSETNPSSCISGNCYSNPLQLTPPYNNNIPKPTNLVATFTSCPSGNCGSFPSIPQTPQHPVTCSTGNCGSPAYQITPLSTSTSSGDSSHVDCSSGKCGTSSYHTAPTQTHAHSGSYTPTACASGHCATGLNTQYSHTNGAHVAAAAAASSKAVVYTGGFGGPPGLLKPYDAGKLKPATIALNQHSTYSNGVPNTGSYSSLGKSITFDTAPVISAGKAQALAATGTSSGVFGGKIYPSGYIRTGSGGCSSGCGTQNGETSLGANNGFLEGAAAKSTVKAGATSYGHAGSFASSSASAYASAGAAVKTGYGR